jgi:WD40 repeat protein
LIVWDLTRGKRIAALTGHKDVVQAVSFSPDGKKVASGAWDGTVRVWDVSTGKELHALKTNGDKVHSVAFSPDGERIVSGSGDRTIHVWNARSGKELLSLEGEPGELAISPDGRALASGSKKGTRSVKLWDLTTGKNITTFAVKSVGELTSLEFSPNGNILACGSYAAISLHETSTGNEVARYLRPPPGGAKVD